MWAALNTHLMLFLDLLHSLVLSHSETFVRKSIEASDDFKLQNPEFPELHKEFLQLSPIFISRSVGYFYDTLLGFTNLQHKLIASMSLPSPVVALRAPRRIRILYGVLLFFFA